MQCVKGAAAHDPEYGVKGAGCQEEEESEDAGLAVLWLAMRVQVSRKDCKASRESRWTTMGDSVMD